MNKINTLTLPGFLNQRGVGFDRMLDLFDDTVGQSGSSYPPYNLIKVSDDDFAVEVALAGFSIDDIEITQNGSKLIIEGNRPDIRDDEIEYLHRGISSRGFTREFVLAEHVSVVEAEMQDGVLLVKLHRELPEEMKPRQIEIKKIGK